MRMSICSGGNRLREQEALELVAAERLQEAVLLFRFHAFRGHGETERPAQMHDGVHEDGGFARRFHTLQEGAIDLDLVEGEAAKTN